MAAQTSGINNEIVDLDMRNWNCRLENDSPVAKKRRVQASFSSTDIGFLKRVDFFFIRCHESYQFFKGLSVHAQISSIIF